MLSSFIMNDEEQKEQPRKLLKHSLNDISHMIPLKHSLMQSAVFKEISDNMLVYIKQVPNLEEHKLNNELILLLCNLIENLCKKKHKIDKLNLLITTMKRVIPLTESDEQVIKQAVEFLHSNKTIKAVAKSKYTKFFLKKFMGSLLK